MCVCVGECVLNCVSLSLCLCAGETPESLFKGKLVTCTVLGIVCRKPPREVLDRANPIENKATGYWQCPFCLKDDFRELSMVGCVLNHIPVCALAV